MKSNQQLQGLIQELRKQDAPIWKRVALDLSKPSRRRRVVNLSKINQHTKENEAVVVPGKVLGVGELDHKVTVAAYTFSRQALEKIQNSKGTVYSLYDFMKKNPKGAKARIIG